MQVYQLTSAERELVEDLPAENTILIVCDLGGEAGCIVDYASLISAEYTKYFNILSPLDETRILTVAD